MGTEQLVQWWLEGYQESAISHGLTSEKLEDGLVDLGYSSREIARQISEFEIGKGNF